MKLRYAPRARLDIAEIHDYIAQGNSSAILRDFTIVNLSYCDHRLAPRKAGEVMKWKLER